MHVQNSSHLPFSATVLSIKIACAALFLVLTIQVRVSAAIDDPAGQSPALPSQTSSSSPENSTSTGSFSSERAMTGRLTEQAVFRSVSGSRTIPAGSSHPEGASDGWNATQAVPESGSPDWAGILRDTGILTGSQVVAAGLIYLMPESVSNWSSEQKRNSFKKYATNVVHPVIDKDKFYINYVLHPYWGATYYIRGRERGLDMVSAFIYSAMISAAYEFGVECFFEKPSIQDLIVTPVAGSLVGALLFEPLRDAIKRKQELSWYDHAALVITDPVGVLSLAIESLFGMKSTVMVEYSLPQLQKLSSESSRASKEFRVGAALQFALH